MSTPHFLKRMERMGTVLSSETLRVVSHESVRVRWVRGVHGVRRVENPAQNLSEVASPGSSRKKEIASRSGAGRRVRNDYLLGSWSL